LIAKSLKCQGYTTVFFVAGGNIMHLIESFSSEFRMVPVIHEVAAVIATDYFNELSSNPENRALALVTVGPGLTNTITGLASAFTDSREVLLIAGQVKSTDLKLPGERAYGVQEVDGISLVSSVTKKSARLEEPISEGEFLQLVSSTWQGRKGPVAIEICLDVQGTLVDPVKYQNKKLIECSSQLPDNKFAIKRLQESLSYSYRPVLLIGGGVPRKLGADLCNYAEKLGIPMSTTWNGADRVDSQHPLYVGRPNMYGQRWSNLIIQQADLILVFGSSLGLQQIGFNYQEFAPLAKVVQFDIEPRPKIRNSGFDLEVVDVDLNTFLPDLFDSTSTPDLFEKYRDWVEFIQLVRVKFPVVEEETALLGEINPFELVYELSKKSDESVVVVSCSSGGTYTTVMQVFQNQKDQLLVSSKSMGSMGFGVSGAIGAAMATGKLTWLFDGDGGFAQNLQELGTIVANDLPIKIIIFSNNGYGSIRSTQQKYFSKNYVGCDPTTGVVLPRLDNLALAYGLEYSLISTLGDLTIDKIAELYDHRPRIFEVMVSSKQPYFPKILSSLAENGEMRSNPLHLMYPEIRADLQDLAFRYLPEAARPKIEG